MERTLKLGTAYHGNRFLHQVDADMLEEAIENQEVVRYGR